MIDTESGDECDGDQVLGEDGEGEFYEGGVMGKCEGKEEEEGGIEVLAGHSVVGSRKKKRKKKKRALTDKEKQSLMKREEVKA